MGHPSQGSRARTRALLATSTLAILALALAHPRGAASPWNAPVHGGLTVLLWVQLVGLAGFYGTLGPNRLLVRLAFAAQSASVIAYSGAALINGFLVGRYLDLALPTEASGTASEPNPRFFHGHQGASHTPGDDPPSYAVDLCHATNQLLSNTGTLALGLATALASLALVDPRSRSRILGPAGILLGLVLVAGILSSHLEMNLHGLILVVLAQSIWTLGAAVQMGRTE